MNMPPKAIAISIFAAAASALCIMASYGIGAGASPLMLIAAFPIYVAALSQGTAVGTISSILAMFITAVFTSPEMAVALGLGFTIPASIIGHQANLAQVTNGKIEWYPLSRLFFNLCILLSIGLVILGYMSGYNPERLTPLLEDVMKEALAANPPARPLTEADTKAIIASVFTILPFVFAGIWLIIHVISIYFASIVCRASDMLARPKDDIALEAGLPKAAVAIMLVCLIASFTMTGIIKLMLLVVAGIFLMALSLLGLANLHLRARKNPAGIALVIASYGAIFFVYPVLYLFSISGILRTFNPPQNPNQSPPPAV